MNAPVFTPDAETLRRQLPDLAEGLSNQIAELHARPLADAAERLAWNLDGARRLILAFREQLMAEGERPTESASSRQVESDPGTCSQAAVARADGDEQ